MPFNGSGVFQRVRNWVADAAAGIKIRADYHDAEDDGFAAGLTNCVTKDGQTLITQNIPWNSKRITGLADPVNPQDAATKAYADTKMPKDGGVMTGDITIRKPTPSLFLDATGDTGAQLSGKQDGNQRWLLRLGNDTADAGGNVGSDFDLHRYTNDGAYLGQVLNFSRATGLGTVEGNPTAALGIATKGYVDTADAALQTSINTKQASLGFTPVQQGGGAGQVLNKVYIGWSGTSLKAQVDSTDLGSFMFGGGSLVTNVRLNYAGDVAAATGPQSQAYEPYGGAVITGWQWAIVGNATVTAFRLRYMQIYTTTWFTIGYTNV